MKTHIPLPKKTAIYINHAIAAVALMLLAPCLHAANWKSTGSDWFDPTSWGAGTVPSGAVEIYIGADAASSGTAYISNGTASGGNSTNGFSVGHNGFTGGLVIDNTGGLAISSAAAMYIGRSGGNGSLFIRDSGWLTSSFDVSIGRSGAGKGFLEIAGSGSLRATALHVGFQDTASGTALLKDNARVVTGGASIIGGNASGNIAATGVVIISGSAYWSNTTNSHTMLIGSYGSGTFILQDSGSYSTNRTDGNGTAINIGDKNTGSGALILRDSSNLTIASEGLFVGNAGKGVLTIEDNATMNVTRVLITNAATASGTVNLNGGVLTTQYIEHRTGAGALNFDGGTLRASTSANFIRSTNGNLNLTTTGSGAIIDTQAFAVSTTLSFAGDGGLAKLGSGTLTFAAVQNYTGETRVENGLLEFTAASGQTLNNLSGAGTDAAVKSTSLVLASSANSTYAGSLNVSGALAKSGAGALTLLHSGALGSAASLSIDGGALVLTGGTLSVTNLTTLAAGGTLGLTAGSAKIDSGSLSLASGAAIDIFGYTPTLSGAIDLISTTSGITGSLDDIILLRGGQAAGVNLDEYLDAILQLDTTSKILQLASELVWNSTGTAHGTFNIAGAESFALPVTLDDRANGTYTGLAGWDGKSLNKTGAGTLVISTSAAYTGTTTVSTGTLQLATADAIARSAAVSLGANTALVVSSGSQTLQNLSGDSTATIRDAAQLTLRSTANTTYAGIFANVGALAKNDATSLTLSHAGDIGTLGSLAINQGELALTSGTLNITGATTLAASTTLSLAGGVSKIVTGAATFDAGSYINITSGAGTINLVEAGTAITTLSNLTLLNNGVANTVSLDIFNIYGLQLADAGKTLQATTILIWNNSEAHGTFNIASGNTFVAPVALADRTSASFTAFAGWDGKSLTKTGLGTLEFNIANTYTGTTTVSSGTLRLTPANAIATSAAVAISSSGALAISSTQRLNNLSGDGLITLAADSRAVVNSTGATTYAGHITGQGALEKIGAESLLLSGSNDYTGGTTITEGKLIVGNVSALGSGAIVNNSALEFATAISESYLGSITGSGSISLAGNTGLTIGADSTLTTTGGFTLNDNSELGIIVGSGTGPIINAATFVIGSGVSLNISGVTGSTELPFSIIDTTGGIISDFASITIGGGGGSSADYLTVSAQKSDDGKRYLLDATLTWNEIGAGRHGNFTLTDAADVFNVGQVLADRTANFDTGWDGKSLTKLGAGTLILSATNTYTGDTNVAEGTLRLTAANAIANSSAVTLSATGALVAEASQQLNNLAGGGTVGLLNDSHLTLNATVTSTYAGRILGEGSLEKKGASTLTLTGSNDYTGITTITEGKLVAASLAALGGSAIVNNAALELNVAATGTLANPLSGSGVFTKTGSATLVIAGDNSGYTGSTNIDAGMISARHIAALGAGLVTTAANTSFEYAGIADGTSRNDFAGSGTFIVTSSTLSLGGASTIGKNIIKGSVVTLEHAGALGGDTATVNADATSKILLAAGDIRLGALTLNGATLGFVRDPDAFAPKTATLASLSGSNAVIAINVDLALANGVTPGGVAGDYLVITGNATGKHTVAINTGSTRPAEHGVAIELITTGAPTADDTFALSGTTGKITVGLSAYQLKQGDGTGQLPDNRSWYLADVGFSSVADAVFNTAALLGVDWHYSLDSLNLRLGDLRATGKPATTPIPKADRWMRFRGYQLNASSALSGMPFDQYAFGATFGADFNNRLDSSNIVIGAMFDFGNIHRSFDDESSGETRNISGGVYVTWLHDDGWFIDGVVKYDHYNNSFELRTDTSMLQHGSYGSNAQGVSLELGRRIQAADGWWFEGSIQAAVAWLKGAEYDINPNQMKLHVVVDKATAYQYRGQLRFGRQWFSTKVHPYVRLGLVSNVTQGGIVHAATLSRKIDFDGLRAEAGAGFAYHVTPRSQVYADYEYAHAEAYDRPWAVNIGYRRAW